MQADLLVQTRRLQRLRRLAWVRRLLRLIFVLGGGAAVLCVAAVMVLYHADGSSGLESWIGGISPAYLLRSYRQSGALRRKAGDERDLIDSPSSQRLRSEAGVLATKRAGSTQLPLPAALGAQGETGGKAPTGLAEPHKEALPQWLGGLAHEAGRALIIGPGVAGELLGSGLEALDWRKRLAVAARNYGLAFSVDEDLIEVTKADLRSSRQAGAAESIATNSNGTRSHFARTGGSIGTRSRFSQSGPGPVLPANGTGSASAVGSGSAGAGVAGAGVVGTGGVIGTGSGNPGGVEVANLEEFGIGSASSRPGRCAAGPGNCGGFALTAVSGRGGSRVWTDRPVSRVLALNHADADELASVVERASRMFGAVVASDAASNSLLLSGSEEAVSHAASLVEELDTKRVRILLEAEIVELTHSARRELGIQWSFAGKLAASVDFPAAEDTGASSALLLATGGARALEARLAALEAGGQVRVVSSPRVVMLEGTSATIESVRILRVRLPSRSALLGDEIVETSGEERATEKIPVGVKLEVTPRLRSGRDVLLSIEAKSSGLGPPLPPDGIPEELSRSVSAQLLVGDGETAVLGGLLREGSSRSGSGVPGIRGLPFVGALFGKQERENDSEELVVFVTPTILD